MKLFDSSDAVEKEASVKAASAKAKEDDSLLGQIDAFREKAQTLQSLINDRQKKVRDLEEIVREKEEKNQDLQNQLNEKQEAASGVLRDVKNQFEEMNGRLDESLADMEEKVISSGTGNREAITEKLDEIKATLDDKESLSEMRTEISEKIHEENVRMYRNLQDLLAEQESGNTIKEELSERVSSVGRRVNFVIFLTLIDTVIGVMFVLLYFGLL